MRRVVVPRALAAPLPAVARAELVEARGLTMGTTWQVKCVVPTRMSRQHLRDGIQGRLDEVVSQMSNWEPASDLSRFNRAAAGTRLTLPAALADVLAYARTVAEDSRGACDPTAGAIVDVWGFGPGTPYRTRGFEPPSEAAVAAALRRSGWQRLQIDPGSRSAVQPGGLQLDLSAIAKGFGVDQVADYLRGLGVSSFLVEVGGELRGLGVKPDGQPWWVLLEAPDDGESGAVVETVIALHGLSVATSGDYRRYFDSGDTRYCHAIDPRSGRPAARGVASVTVVHADCMAADALSTALMVMGREEGIDWANRRGVAALFRCRAEGVPLTEFMTDRFADLLQ